VGKTIQSTPADPHSSQAVQKLRGRGSLATKKKKHRKAQQTETKKDELRGVIPKKGVGKK